LEKKKTVKRNREKKLEGGEKIPRTRREKNPSRPESQNREPRSRDAKKKKNTNSMNTEKGKVSTGGE